MQVRPDDKSRIGYNPIEFAKTYDQAIEIISQSECEEGVEYLKKLLENTWPDPKEISLIPVMMAGEKIAKRLAGNRYSLNPLRMLYKGHNGERLKVPRCVYPPDYDKILRADGNCREMVLVETVVDDRFTIREIIANTKKEIDLRNRFVSVPHKYPKISTLTLITKPGDNPVRIPNIYAAFKVDKDIWVHGYNCDNEDRGREEDRIMGVLSPFAERTPKEPYYKRKF